LTALLPVAPAAQATPAKQAKRPPPSELEIQAEIILHAQQVAKAWLTEIDGDQYDNTWDHAATLFQQQVTKQQWQIQMIRIRGLLGAVEKRKLIAAELRHNLPGAPDGQYVVLKYESKFEHKMRGLEVVTPMKDADGKWRVAGYIIR
jgi:hypothetical protein